MEHELLTIAFSHYCEKARWALDRYGVAYRDTRCMPLFHLPVVLRRTGRPRGRREADSSPLSTPLLITRDGEIITDSSDIVAWVDRNHAGGALYPDAEVAALERELGASLGPHTRRLAYFYILPERALVERMAVRNVSPTQARWFRRLHRPAVAALARRLRIDADTAADSARRIEAWADRIDRRLEDGRPYLAGDRFTAADLAFATMMAPTLLPEEYGAHLPRADELPAPARAFIQALRDRPSGRFALRMFRDERWRGEPGRVPPTRKSR